MHNNNQKSKTSKLSLAPKVKIIKFYKIVIYIFIEVLLIQEIFKINIEMLFIYTNYI